MSWLLRWPGSSGLDARERRPCVVVLMSPTADARCALGRLCQACLDWLTIPLVRRAVDASLAGMRLAGWWLSRGLRTPALCRKRLLPRFRYTLALLVNPGALLRTVAGPGGTRRCAR